MKKNNMSHYFEYWHNNPPPPFNPDYDPNHEKWWGGYVARVRKALIARYLELYPDGEVDGEHFGEVRNEILRSYVDPLRSQFVIEAKREAGLGDGLPTS